MKPYLTKRDKEILKFIETYNSLTINLCHKIFIPSTSGYKIAQRRLNKMVENGHIKVFKPRIGEENIYYIDKRLSNHDLLILSFYAELVRLGANNIEFERDKKWLDGKIISDAIFKYEFGDYLYYNILEVCYTHKKIPIENYEELFKSKEAHNQCNDTFPRIVVMDDVTHANPKHYHSDLFKIIQVDLSLNDISLIFVD